MSPGKYHLTIARWGSTENLTVFKFSKSLLITQMKSTQDLGKTSLT